MKILRVVILLCALSSAQVCLSAEVSPLPATAGKYIASKGLKYTAPHGKFDQDLMKYMREKGNPHPWYLEADFNGDKKKDFAGLLRTRKGKLEVVAIYSSKGGYTHQVLVKDASPDSKRIFTAIYAEPPGTVYGFPFDTVPPEELVAHLKHPGIHVVFFESSAVLYYWKDGTFKELWTAD